MTYVHIDCPFCGEPFSFAADAVEGARQSLVVDCEICCRPIVVSLAWEADHTLSVRTEREGGG